MYHAVINVHTATVNDNDDHVRSQKRGKSHDRPYTLFYILQRSCAIWIHYIGIIIPIFFFLFLSVSQKMYVICFVQSLKANYIFSVSIIFFTLTDSFLLINPILSKILFKNVFVMPRFRILSHSHILNAANSPASFAQRRYFIRFTIT